MFIYTKTIYTFLICFLFITYIPQIDFLFKKSKMTKRLQCKKLYEKKKNYIKG